MNSNNLYRSQSVVCKKKLGRMSEITNDNEYRISSSKSIPNKSNLLTLHRLGSINSRQINKNLNRRRITQIDENKTYTSILKSKLHNRNENNILSKSKYIHKQIFR